MSLRIFAISFGVLSVALLSSVLLYSHYFGPADPFAGQVQFIVTPGETNDQVDALLKTQGFIRSRTAFRIALLRDTKGATIRPGGYNLSASMDVWSIASALSKPPYLVFFSFLPGWRKEQIAEKLATTFSWTPEQVQHWLNIDTAPEPSFVEGVYYPTTYLIPADRTPAAIARQFSDRFKSEFSTAALSATRKDLPWTEVVILASLIEREAAGPADRALIAGIMLNRLTVHMPLQIDATLQYIKGSTGNWWPVPMGTDKLLESPFNTYKHLGLPPHAIANPGLDAINAVLNPQATDCLYYLHDTKGSIHCSKTYAGQLANVKKYLK
jgi:UPF0755 protein